MYQNMFHGDDTRMRNLPVEHLFAPQQYIGLPRVSVTTLVRQRTGDALIALGTWIKPQRPVRPSRRRAAAW
ncbi:MAG: hypothetical protein WEC16_00955 [Anaerolineales bacterium]